MTDHQEHLLLKLLTGTISPDESRIINAWIEESPENKKLAEDFTLMWKISKSNPTTPDFQTQGEWIKLQASINAEVSNAKEFKLFSNTNWLKIAASVAFLALCSWLLYLFVFNHDTILKESRDAMVQLALPDGSKVWLNHDSRLSYRDDFNKENRIVKLEGEGFFEVKKNAQKPFVIETDQAQIKVLGTSFNVQSYSSTSGTEVFVVTGFVRFASIKDRHNGIVLKPGESGTLSKNNDLVVLSTAENRNVLAWKEKRLSFKKTSLHDVVESLEEYFKIDIKIKNQDAMRCRFTGSFNKPTIEEILEALRISLDLEITKQEDTYVVEGNGC